MENTQSESKMKYALPLIAVVIVIVAVVAVYATNKKAPVNHTSSPAVSENTTPNSPISEDTTESEYKDGTYSADGHYVSPGGPRDIGVTITLQNGVVTDTNFDGRAVDPTSQRFQGEFRDNYAAMIIGKNIDDVALTKVAGSSLTPIGFRDALEKIKAEAKS